MTIKRVVPNISVKDFEQSRDFYENLLGFEVLMDMGWIVTVGSPSNPSVQISLQEQADEDGPHLTIEVDDVDSVHEAMSKREIEVVYELRDEEWGVRRFFVRDPNGLVINIMSHRR